MVATVRGLLALLLVAVLLTSCGALSRSGQTPVPGPTGSPTGSPIGTPIPGVAEDDADPANPDATTTEEPDFQG